MLVFQPVFACRGLATFKLQITLALSFRFAVPTTLALSRRLFPPKSSLVKHNLLHAPMPATTTSGRDSQHQPNTISTPLGMVLLMLVNGVTRPNLLATMLQLTLAWVQRMALPGCLSRPTSQQPRPCIRGPLKSKAIFLALANTKTASSALSRDATQTAARSVPFALSPLLIDTDPVHRCL